MVRFTRMIPPGHQQRSEACDMALAVHRYVLVLLDLFASLRLSIHSVSLYLHNLQILNAALRIALFRDSKYSFLQAAEMLLIGALQGLLQFALHCAECRDYSLVTDAELMCEMCSLVPYMF